MCIGPCTSVSVSLFFLYYNNHILSSLLNSSLHDLVTDSSTVWWKTDAENNNCAENIIKAETELFVFIM